VQYGDCPSSDVLAKISSLIATWYLLMSLTVREEHRLRVFENRGLRRIFGP
jgi:hypothetical protein